MTVNIPGMSVVATKMASGNVRIECYDLRGPVNSSLGQLRFALVIPSADFTSFNTTVNGGATGATLTRNYTQDQFPNDYQDNMAPPSV